MIVNKDKLCEESWKDISLSKKDTVDTQKQIVANNEARKPWCK